MSGKLTRKPARPSLLFIRTKVIMPMPDVIVAPSAIAAVERFNPWRERGITMNTVEWSVVEAGLTVKPGATQQVLVEGGVWLTCRETRLIADIHRNQADAVLELKDLDGQGSGHIPCNMRVPLSRVIGAYSRVPKA